MHEMDTRKLVSPYKIPTLICKVDIQVKGKYLGLWIRQV